MSNADSAWSIFFYNHELASYYMAHCARPSPSSTPEQMARDEKAARPDGPVIVLVEEFGPADPLALMSLVSVDGKRWSDHLATTFEELQNPGATIGRPGFTLTDEVWYRLLPKPGDPREEPQR